MYVKEDPRGRFYADMVSIRERIQDRAAAKPGSRIQRVDGTVEQVDIQRGSFEIRESSGTRVIVALPYDAQRSDIDRLHRLRHGDSVVLEGRFLNRDRFELEAFL
jgi:thioredoxin reductase